MENTSHLEFFDGIPVVVPNITTETKKDSFRLWHRCYDRYYISYNTRDANIYGHATTALVLEHDKSATVFLILNGDHRGEYEKLKTIKECFTYYVKNQKYQNKEFSDTRKRMKKYYKNIEGLA